MKELIVILLFGCFFGSCQDTIENEIIIENEYSVLGKYRYSNDSLESFYFLELEILKDSTFKETQENMQCYNRLPNFFGRYLIKDSILTCNIEDYVWTWETDSTERISSASEGFLRFDKNDQKPIKYLIKGDSLINLSNPEIRLCKVKETIKKKNKIIIKNEYSVLGEKYKYSSLDSTDNGYEYYFLTMRFFADSVYKEIQDSVKSYAAPSGFDGKYYIKDSTLYCERRNTVVQWETDSTSKIKFEGIYSRFQFIQLHSKYLIKGDSLINLSNPEIRLCKVKENE